MAVHIFDADVMDRLALVEGEGFRDEGAAGVAAFLAEWRAYEADRLAHPDIADADLGSLRPEGWDRALYGTGGYSRYQVSANTGEMVFLVMFSSRPAKTEAARAAGFRVG